MAGRRRAALDRPREHRALRRAGLVRARDARRPGARTAARGRGGARRPPAGPAHPGGGAGAPRAALGAAGHRAPSAACRSSSAAATRRRRGWCGSAASTARSCGWRSSGTPTSASASPQLPGADGTRAVPLDPWLAEELDAFIARHDVQVTGRAVEVLERLLAEHRSAADAVRRSRADRGRADRPRRRRCSAASWRRFSGPAVRYVLDARRDVPGRRAGARQDRRGAGRARGRRRLPRGRRLPGVDEARLAARGAAVAAPPLGGGRRTGAARCRRAADITILNYEIVAAHRETLARARPRALVVDESHYCKNPQAKRTQAVRRLAAACAPDGLRLALTGTPVLNHAEELIAQLRVIGRHGGLRLRRALRPPVPRQAQRGAAALAPAPRAASCAG